MLRLVLCHPRSLFGGVGSLLAYSSFLSMTRSGSFAALAQFLLASPDA
jgi:hypothetical protein